MACQCNIRVVFIVLKWLIQLGGQMRTLVRRMVNWLEQLVEWMSVLPEQLDGFLGQSGSYLASLVSLLA
jgi:hypothetical protein